VAAAAFDNERVKNFLKKRGRSPKLQRKWDGPYKIIAPGKSPNTYKVELVGNLRGAKIPKIDTINITRMKKAHIRNSEDYN